VTIGFRIVTLNYWTWSCIVSQKDRILLIPESARRLILIPAFARIDFLIPRKVDSPA
jgi:hypothetical protein